MHHLLGSPYFPRDKATRRSPSSIACTDMYSPFLHKRLTVFQDHLITQFPRFPNSQRNLHTMLGLFAHHCWSQRRLIRIWWKIPLQLLWTTIHFWVDCLLKRLPPLPAFSITSMNLPWNIKVRAASNGSFSSIVHCAPTSLPTNSIYFHIRRIRRRLLVDTSSVTGDWEASLLTIRRSEVGWSVSISLWDVPAFTASPTLVAVQMNGRLMFPDHHFKFLYSSTKFNIRPFQVLKILKALLHAPLQDFLSISVLNILAPFMTMGWSISLWVIAFDLMRSR